MDRADYIVDVLKPLPPKARAVLAVRAAMRTLPATHPALWFWQDGDRARLMLVVCRCLQFSTFVSSLRNDETAPQLDEEARDTADAASAALEAQGTDSAAVVSARIALTAVFAATAATDAYAAGAGNVGDARAATAVDVALSSFSLLTAESEGGDDAAIDAFSLDVARIRPPSFLDRLLGRRDDQSGSVLGRPLWPKGVPVEAAGLWDVLQHDLRGLNAGFEVWIDWYQDRLDGRPWDWELERRCALSTTTQAHDPAAINANLRRLRGGALAS